MGHAGTAASAALGIAMGDRMQGKKRESVAVVGDAAMGCGVAFEALNHAGSLENDKLLVILNDNRWSIAKTVGALSRHLNKLRSGTFYNRKFFGLIKHPRKASKPHDGSEEQRVVAEMIASGRMRKLAAAD